MILDAIGCYLSNEWYLIVVDGGMVIVLYGFDLCGWFWMVFNGIRWFWIVLDGFQLFWILYNVLKYF